MLCFVGTAPSCVDDGLDYVTVLHIRHELFDIHALGLRNWVGGSEVRLLIGPSIVELPLHYESSHVLNANSACDDSVFWCFGRGRFGSPLRLDSLGGLFHIDSNVD